LAKKARKKTKKRSKKAQKKAQKKAKSPLFVESKDAKKSSSKVQALIKYNEDEDHREKYKFRKEFIRQAQNCMTLGLNKDELAKKLGVHDKTIDRWASENKSFKDALTRGEADFIKGLPDKLIEYRKQGHSFEAFSSIARRGKNWLYELARSDKRFKRAKELANGDALDQWENLGIAQASGRLVRVSKEVIRTNAKGEPLKNPTTGEILTDKTYVAALGDGRTLQFLMRAMFLEYKDDNKNDQQTLHDELKEIMEAADREDLKKTKEGLNEDT